MISTYLTILLASLFLPLVLSFDRKVAFYRRWKYLFPSIVFSIMIFIPWDVTFTRLGVWGFNSVHISGIKILSLPLEEWLFFIVIPYASVFTMDVVQAYFSIGHRKKETSMISLILILLSALMLIFFGDRIYTLTTFAMLILLVSLNQWILKSRWLMIYYVSYLLIIIPFMVVNGILTGTAIQEEVVWYNDMENMGRRIGTIPVEDFFYGFNLILLNVTFYKLFSGKN